MLQLEKGLLKNEEKAVFTLRSLYKKYGYLPYKMSKFEEYDLYVRNKEFLVSDSIITFTDYTGRLLALKPDVTLSILKNTTDEPGFKEKVFYNENVYRGSAVTHQYKEIVQTGLECIGDIDLSDVFEVVYLALASLESISSDFVFDLSHMGVLSSVIDGISDDEGFKKEITRFISERNIHDATALCERYGVEKSSVDILTSFIGLYGSINEVLPKLSLICKDKDSKKAFDQLERLCKQLSKTEFADRIRLDFSVVNDMNYYNGIVFKGFLNGISEGVLSGGEYGGLLARMGRTSNAVGFAVYIDLLEQLYSEKIDYDVDVLVVYDENNSAEEIFDIKKKYILEGKKVSAQRVIPKKLRFRELVDIR